MDDLEDFPFNGENLRRPLIEVLDMLHEFMEDRRGGRNGAVREEIGEGNDEMEIRFVFEVPNNRNVFQFPLFDDGDEEDDDDFRMQDEVEDHRMIDLQKTFRNLSKIQKVLADRRIERAARGLPERNEQQFDPQAILDVIVKVLDKPAEAGDPDIDGFVRILNAVADEIDEMERQRPIVRDEHRYGRGDFQLPDNVKEQMSGREIQIIESCVDVLRDSIQNGGRIPGVPVFQRFIREARKFGVTDELLPEIQLKEIVEEIVETREYRTRILEYQFARRALRPPRRRAFKGPYEEPTSEILYVPRMKKHNWKYWNENDVRTWIRMFITNQAHLEFIDSKELNGNRLGDFIQLEDQWKVDKWPFGVYMNVKSHFNRVKNRDNGYRHRRL